MVFVIWMTGLPCSGKSTIAKKLGECIPELEVLDGDEIGKWILPKNFGWTREERIEATARIALYKASTKLPIKTKFIKRF